MAYPTDACHIGAASSAVGEVKVPHLEEFAKVDVDPSTSSVVAEHDTALSERSTSLGAEAAMSDKASTRSDASPRQNAAEAGLEAAVRRPETSEATARWSDLSEDLLVKTELDDELDDEAFPDSPTVASTPGSPKKSSRRSTRRRRRREEAIKNGGNMTGYARDQAAVYVSQPADSRHVVTLDDLGFDLGHGASNYGRAGRGNSFMSGGGATEDATRMGATRPTYWDTMGSSPCKARVGMNGVISTSPTVAGTASISDASARRPAPLDNFGEIAPQQLFVSSPSHCHGAAPVAAFAHAGHCGGVATSATCDASSRIPSACMPGANVQALAPCLLVSTSPIASKSETSGYGGGNTPWSPAAGSPAADALRSLFHGHGFSSRGGADLAAHLQAAAPDAYED